MGVLALLRQKNVRLLLSAQLVSELGSVMQSFALSLYAYAKTRSEVIFASVFAISIIPRLFGPFSGVITDRVNRKRLIVTLDAVAGALTLCFALWHWFVEPLPLSCVYIFVFILSAVQTFNDPAVSAILPELVEEKWLKLTNICSTVVISSATILGPAIASVMNPEDNGSMTVIMIVNSLSFFIAAAVETALRNNSAVQPRGSERESVLDSMKEGMKAIFGNTELKMIVMLSIVSNFALNPVFSVGVSIILLKDANLSGEMIGLSRSILYVGPILGSLLAGVLLRRTDYRRMLTRILFADGGLLVLMAAALVLSPLAGSARPTLQFLAINLAALCVVATVVVASIAVTTAMQKIVPGNLMGRVSSVDASLSVIVIPVGQMLFGLVSDSLGSSFALVFFAIVALAAGTFAWTMYKPMLRDSGNRPGKTSTDSI